MKYKIIFIAFMILFCAGNIFAQNEKFKALYIYNITKYINWSSNDKTEYFVIGVLGNSDIIEELKTIAKKRKINEKNVQVVKYSSINDVTNCHILFLTSAKSNLLSNFTPKKYNNILIITEKKGMIDIGAAINFIEIEGILKFEVNTNNITKYGLKYNSELLNFSIK